MSIDFSGLRKYVVFADDGSVDHEATVVRFRRALTAFDSAMTISKDKIAAAVNKVFDTHKGTNIAGVLTFIKNNLDITPENCSWVEKKVVEYMKENSGEYGEALYGVGRGKNGGTWRWSDKKPESKEVKNSLEAIVERDKGSA